MNTTPSISEIRAMTPEQQVALNRTLAVKVVKRIAFRIVAGVAVVYVVTKLVEKYTDPSTETDN